MAVYRYTLNPVPNTSPQQYTASLQLTDRPIYGSKRLGSHTRPMEMVGTTPPQYYPYTQPMPAYRKHYELTDHLGNVATVVTGRLLPGNGAGSDKQAEVLSAQGYEPFGMELPGRHWQSDVSRFGFQGQLKDREIAAIPFKYRMYSPDGSGFWSVDPLAKEYPWNSPYAFSENRVVDAIELEGMESMTLNDGSEVPTGPASKSYQDNLGGSDIKNYADGSSRIPSVGTLLSDKYKSGSPERNEYLKKGHQPLDDLPFKITKEVSNTTQMAPTAFGSVSKSKFSSYSKGNENPMGTELKVTTDINLGTVSATGIMAKTAGPFAITQSVSQEGIGFGFKVSGPADGFGESAYQELTIGINLNGWSIGHEVGREVGGLRGGVRTSYEPSLLGTAVAIGAGATAASTRGRSLGLLPKLMTGTP